MEHIYNAETEEYGFETQLNHVHVFCISIHTYFCSWKTWQPRLHDVHNSYLLTNHHLPVMVQLTHGTLTVEPYIWPLKTSETCSSCQYGAHMRWFRRTVRCRNNAVSFLTNIHKMHPYLAHYSSPLRMRYGLYFVDPAYDWYTASVSVIIHALSYSIGPR